MDLVAVTGGGENVCIRRTVSWQNVASWTLTGKTSKAICWSPDGKFVAVGLSDGSLVILEIEAGMREQDEDDHLQIAAQYGTCETKSISTIHWAHVGIAHPSWTLTEAEMLREEEWIFTRPFLDRSAHFLPPSTYHLGEYIESDTSQSSSPRCELPLSALFVATQLNQIHIHLHARFTLGPFTTLTTPQAMHASHDLSYLLVQHDNGRLTIFHFPSLAQDRYLWQQVSSLHASIGAHISSIQRWKTQVSQSWKAAIHPLEEKLKHIQSTLEKYGISTPLTTIFLRYIVIGPLGESVVSAIDQAFTSVHMNDQLLLRMEKTLKVAVANVESMSRAGLLAPARSLVYDVTQLAGLGYHGGTDLLEMCCSCFISMEFLVQELVEARSRLQDLTTWLRGTAAKIKAKGTANDSVQQENSKKRRPSQVIIQRIVGYFGSEGIQSEYTTETLIGLSIAGKLSDKKVVRRDSSPISAQHTNDFFGDMLVSVDKAFEDPKALFSNSIHRRDVLLPGLGQSQITAIHTRMGAGTDFCFQPKVTSDECRNCRQWALAAAAREFSDGQCGIQLIVLPLVKESNYYLVSRMILPSDTTLKELGFYGDDGKSALFFGENSGSGKEGRQGLGMILKHKSGVEELWIVNYENLIFHSVDLKGYPGSLLPDVDILDLSTVNLLPVQRYSCENMDSVRNLFAKSKWKYSFEGQEINL